MQASPQKSTVVSHLRGPLFALLAAVLFGISPPLAKRLVNTTNPHLLAGLLYLGSGVGLGAMLLIRRFWTPTKTTRQRVAGREWLWLAGAILFGGVAAPMLLMTGLARTEATSASLLLSPTRCRLEVPMGWEYIGGMGVNRGILSMSGT